MKKQFEMPVVNIDMFSTENLITTSGEPTNVTQMQTAMEAAGYKAKSVSLTGTGFTFNVTL